MKSSFCIDLQRFMLIPTKFPLSPLKSYTILFSSTSVGLVLMLYFGRLLPTFLANATEATTNIHVNKKKNSILPLVLLLHHKYTKSICGGNANGNISIVSLFLSIVYSLGI